MNRFESQSFWICAPGQGEIRTESLRPPSPEEVLIRTSYSGVSRGTESLVFQGRIPVSQYGLMRAPFQAGQFPAPVKYGYSSVGTVEQGPDELVGKTVFCLHPHQSIYVVPAAAVVPLPPGLPAARAVLAANMETALNALWDVPPLMAQHVAVIGAGTVGCLLGYLVSRIPGCRAQLIDINASKAEIAAHLGVGFRLPHEADKNADLIIHASGTSAGLATALALAGFEATILEVSWFGDQPVSLPLGEAFHSRRLSIRCSQVGTVAPRQRARWSRRRRLEAALALLGDAALDQLISGESRFLEMPDVMPTLLSTPGGALCHRIVY